MEGEMMVLLQVCAIVIASLIYCFFVCSKLPKGIMRLISILPIVSIFTFLPLRFSFFYLQYYGGGLIGWLANFNLLLFVFGRDDTLSSNPDISLLQFILLTILPIKLKHKSTPRRETIPWWKTTLPINLFFWVFSAQFYKTYKDHLFLNYPFGFRGLFNLRLFFGVQANFAIFAALAKPFFGGREFAEQFNSPLLSTSIQDYWDRRWNCITSNSLRTSIRVPTRSLLTPILGKRWSLHAAILATSVVSGLMHELVQFYIIHQRPTWGVFWFFIIHTVALSIEIELKNMAATKGWKLHFAISWLLTWGFIYVTGSWLVYAEVIHSGADVREIEEYNALFTYLVAQVAQLVARLPFISV